MRQLFGCVIWIISDESLCRLFIVQFKMLFCYLLALYKDLLENFHVMHWKINPLRSTINILLITFFIAVKITLTSEKHFSVKLDCCNTYLYNQKTCMWYKIQDVNWMKYSIIWDININEITFVMLRYKNCLPIFSGQLPIFNYKF